MPHGRVPPDRERLEGFTIEPRNKFFEANRAIVDHEMRPGRTVSFLGEVDLGEVERIRAESWTSRKASYTAFVVKAVALALRDFPYANRRVCRAGVWPFGGARLQSFQARDVAVAVEREVPGAEATAFLDVIRSADAASLDEITAQLQALSQADVATNRQWREFSGLINRLPNWLSSLLIRLPLFVPKYWVQYRGGSVLVSSPAKYGVDAVLGTWSHPLGVSFGLVKPRPVVVDGAIVARPTFLLTLNFDRRVMAGAQAARFFKRIITVLEDPIRELDDFQIAGGYFDAAWQARQGGSPLPAPPTRPDFPTLPASQLPPSSHGREAPETREEIPTLED